MAFSCILSLDEKSPYQAKFFDGIYRPCSDNFIVDLSPVSDVGPTPHSRTALAMVSWGGSQIRRG